MTAASRGAAHWDAAYAHGADTRSWFQVEPTASLSMLDAADVTPADSVIDVGGGASTLVDALLRRGHRDVTVLDVSDAGLQLARHRLAGQAADVTWLVTDLLAWRPARTWRVWHDRAVLHFITDQAARKQYLNTLAAATEPGAIAVLAAFAPDGPQQCSGLPVDRYNSTDLVDLLGPRWQLIHEDREEHTTPTGAIQPFTWTAFHRRT